MQRFFLFRSKARRLCLLLVAMIAVGLPVGCSVLAQKERELVFRIEPGNASWFSGLPRGVEELQLTHSTFGNQQNIHAWWWPAADADAPALLYLHGVRWNLTGHLFRLEQLRNLGFSVLAIDYRGVGQSLGELPSERSVYADARVGWERLKALQPDGKKRLSITSPMLTTWRSRYARPPIPSPPWLPRSVRRLACRASRRRSRQNPGSACCAIPKPVAGIVATLIWPGSRTREQGSTSTTRK